MSNSGLSANSQNIKKFQLQQKGRNLLLLLLIAIPLFIGGFIYVLFQQYADETTSAELITDYDGIDPQSTAGTPTTDGSISAPVYVPTDSSTGNSSTNTSVASNPAAGIPNGVSVAMNSIETNGINGSSYIADTLDTSNLPTGSTVKFDRASWVQLDDTTGSVNSVVTALGTPYQGSVTFTNYSGVWKVSGYGLNS